MFIKRVGEKNLEGVADHWHGNRFAMKFFFPKSLPNEMSAVINRTRSLGSVNFPAEETCEKPEPCVFTRRCDQQPVEQP